MTADIAKLDTTGSASKGTKAVGIYETTDTLATVMATGYFNSYAKELARVGALQIFASDGFAIVTVSIASGVVTLGGVNLGGAPFSQTTATVTLGDAHVGRPVVFNKADGITATLPAATGSGKRFEIIVGTTFSGGSGVIQVVGNDTMTGQQIALQDGGDTLVAFETAADSDTITLNGTTKGGIKGDRVLLTDIAADLWHVQIINAATGTEASAFSAAVS